MSNLHRAAETIYMLALKAIANDENLKCECGILPYVDGEECPKCTAALALYRVEELQGRIVRHRNKKGGLRGRKLNELITAQKADENDRRIRFENAIG
jgi:hypothetical protein